MPEAALYPLSHQVTQFRRMQESYLFIFSKTWVNLSQMFSFTLFCNYHQSHNPLWFWKLWIQNVPLFLPLEKLRFLSTTFFCTKKYFFSYLVQLLLFSNVFPQSSKWSKQPLRLSTRSGCVFHSLSCSLTLTSCFLISKLLHVKTKAFFYSISEIESHILLFVAFLFTVPTASNFL